MFSTLICAVSYKWSIYLIFLVFFTYKFYAPAVCQFHAYVHLWVWCPLPRIPFTIIQNPPLKPSADISNSGKAPCIPCPSPLTSYLDSFYWAYCRWLLNTHVLNEWILSRYVAFLPYYTMSSKKTGNLFYSYPHIQPLTPCPTYSEYVIAKWWMDT